MRRMLLIVTLTTAIAGLGAPSALAEPTDGSPASCNGYLSSFANPNMGFIVHAILQPTAEALGVPAGAVQSGLARLHDGSLEACIP